ncbi:hypothetical protein Q5P01_001072 [Channa striata]|uniref:Uncharacterized protein n=1 Tax=Channa striata TaxID=64152 RepID=A0AA88NNX3_CHASR|nr:hypothetical protein Q5P01_001072 [Channa striata]
MGSGYSQEDYERISLLVYEAALREPCLLPDVGIDESLLKYSGLTSNSELQALSNELVSSVPVYVDRLGSALAPLTSVPNAVGLGALVISMIMEICIKGASQTGEDSYSLLRRVFGEEKASAVRDTMSTYLWRHRMNMKDKKKLQREIQRLEQQLSHELNILKNSLLLDGQMSTRGFKIWVNGASFHVQMLIHEARLDSQRSSHYADSISAAIMLYLQDLESLLDKYKSYRISTITTRQIEVIHLVSLQRMSAVHSDLYRTDLGDL